MKNSKLTKALIVVSTIGAIASVARLIIMILDKKSQRTDEVLFCECDDDGEYTFTPEVYDQDEEDEDNE